ncbi:MAG: hypothetical protein ACLSX0_14425 [Anaerostipes caccae]|uniref:hypothetical protein n=1 Tax=Faecalimonas umbilicata TaxID=1912855 RepID=UPI0039934960
MYNIEYASLNYYHSPISDECLCIGVLFHNVTTGQRDFKYISNFHRFHAFDDEADIDFVKLYLRGIKDEVETSVFNFNKDFDLTSYIRVYANEFRFSSIRKISVNENENYVEDLSKIYLKYDLAKSQRLNSNEEKKLIRRVLESNNLEYTTQKVAGPYSDEITFDYQVGNVCIKMFSFKGKNLKRVIGSARQWSFIADELGNQKKVLFIYDSDYEDMSNLNIIIKMLSKNAKVLKLDDGMDYILKQCS